MELGQTGSTESCTVARTPLRSGTGASFRTHNLVQASQAELIFQPSLTLKLFVSVFIVLGVLGVPAGAAMILIGGHLFSGILLLLSGVGSVWVGRRFYKVSNIPRGLNLRNNTILLPTMQFFSKSDNPETVIFAEVKALQIVEKRIHSEKNSYYCYELNVVTKSGQRYHLVEHADREQMVKDAETLGRYLACDILFEEM